MTRRWLALAGAVAFAVLLSFWGCGGGIPVTQEMMFQNKRALHPAEFQMDGVELETAPVYVDGTLAVDAWHFRQAGSRCTVLFFGGQGFHMVLSRDFVQRILTELPVDLIMTDYRGYGRSEGEPRVDTMKADALDIYEAARQRAETDCIILHGHSMGTFVATWLASQRDVSGLVLQNPATNAKQWANSMIPWFMRPFVSFNIEAEIAKQDNLTRLENFDAPLLILAGEDDPVTPPQLAEKLHERAKAEPKWLAIIPGGEHNGLEHHRAYMTAYRKLLQAAKPIR